MSEYQYYEFCKLGTPLTAEERKTMAALSSRTQLTTHGAKYVYNYGSFRGDPNALLLNYFDIFFYISNWGAVKLIFKFFSDQVDVDKLKKQTIKDWISIKKHKKYVVLTLEINNEEGGGWIEGEEWLINLLPLYEEIKAGNNQLLGLISAIHAAWEHGEPEALDKFLTKHKLSPAQKAFLACVTFE